jgi:hypothetical protein
MVMILMMFELCKQWLWPLPGSRIVRTALRQATVASLRTFVVPQRFMHGKALAHIHAPPHFTRRH